MKLKNILPLFVGALGIFASCADDDIVQNLGEIQVSESSIAIPMTGGNSDEVTVNANGAWTLEFPTDAKGNNTASWLTASTLSGNAGETKLTFSAPATEAGRVAELKLVCGNKTQYLRVNQGTTAPVASTCAEVIAGPDGKNYQVTGTVTSIANTVYGNWYLKDATGEIYIYGTLDKNGGAKNFTSLGIESGDIVTVQGPKTTYNGTVELVDVTVTNIQKSLLKLDSTYVGKDSTNIIPKEGGDLTAFVKVKGDGIDFDNSAMPSWLTVTKIEQYSFLDRNNKTIHAAYVTIHAEANTGGDRTGNAVLTSQSGKNKSTLNIAVEQKGSIIPGTIAEFIAAEKGPQYRLTGIVTKIDAKKKYFMIKDYSGETEVYGAKDAAGKAFDVAVGDLVTVVGKRDAYTSKGKTTIEMTGYTVEAKQATTEISVADFNAKADSETAYYRLTGTVTKIANDNYGNLYIKDDTGELYVYGLVRLYNNKDAKKGFVKAAGLKVGDKITVVGYKTTYKNTIELAGGYCVGIE